jgi:hypothetical protein
MGYLISEGSPHMTTAYVLIIIYMQPYDRYAITTPVTYATEQACKSVGEAAMEWASKYKCVRIEQ